MLVIDASVTLVTWLPFNLLYSISGGVESLENLTTRQIFILDSLLLGLMMTNVFSSPVIYIIFNRAFRVRKNLDISNLYDSSKQSHYKEYRHSDTFVG